MRRGEWGFVMRRVRRLGVGLASGVAVFVFAVGGGGVALASSSARPVLSDPHLTGISTSVALNSRFVAALQSLKVAPAPSGRASLRHGVASFPITGGHVTVYKPGAVDPYVQGLIDHQGSGLTLTKGRTAVQIDNFVIDPGKPAILTGRVLVNGSVFAAHTTLFDLDGSTLRPVTTNKAGGTATLTGTTVHLSGGVAKALNGAFKTTALKGGTTIGIATIVVRLPRR